MTIHIDVGFCAKCGVVREDRNGAPHTDCSCTAAERHSPQCLYTKSVSCPIDVGVYCKHGRVACELCDCDCAKLEAHQ